MKNEIFIIAPHADDDIIGCWEILENKNLRPIIIYTENMDDKRKQETLKLKEYCNIKMQLYLRNIPPSALNDTNTFLFPHPIYETHPAHRQQGFIGEQLARQGLNVIFYITEMNAPFKFECSSPNDKKTLLANVYESQIELWSYDHKYFLFSGYDKWVFNPTGGLYERSSDSESLKSVSLE